MPFAPPDPSTWTSDVIEMTPGARRYVLANARTKSLWRNLFNWCVSQNQFDGHFLDVGSGARGTASYHSLLPPPERIRLSSVDISPERRPDKVADVTKDGLPWPDASFDGCMAFNLIEHIYEHERLAHEIARVVRPGGLLHVAVPFIHRVHGDPYDFFRYTGTALTRLFREAGFSSGRVTALGTGAFGAALHMINFALPGPVQAPMLRAALRLDAAAAARSTQGFRNGADYPLGYYLVARRG